MKEQNKIGLIVDDDYYSYVYINELLHIVKPNLKTVHVKNGLKAVDLCKSLSDIGVILMDIRMPKMDGIEAIIQIRKIMPDVPIIIQTAFSEEKLVTLNHLKCNEILRKPINGDIFCNIIEKYL